MSLRHLALPSLIPLLWLIACDRKQPLAPALEAGVSGAGGPTVKAPSNTSASAASDSRIDISWQDNSTNETGFEVWRSPNGLGGTFTKVAGTGASLTKYSDEGLKAATQYCYKMRAFRNYDSKTSYSDFSSTACATTPVPPAPNAPSTTNAVPTNSSTVEVTWTDNSANEDGFRVERSPDGITNWVTVAPTAANATSFQDGGRSSEEQVCYRVIAFNAGGDSPTSNTDCTRPPAAPTGLTATGVDGPAIDLSWTDQSTVDVGYAVQRSTDGVSFNSLTDLPANSTSYQDGAVTSNATYWYRVRAKRDNGFSDFSNVARATAGNLLPPYAPSLFQPQGYYLGTIWLDWYDGSSNEDGFKVERCDRSTCGDADFTLIAITGANASSYQDYGLDGVVYTYRIRATNRAGDSPPSNEASGRACIDGVDPESPCFP